MNFFLLTKYKNDDGFRNCHTSNIFSNKYHFFTYFCEKLCSTFIFILDTIFYTKTFECFTEIVCYFNINIIQKFNRIDDVIVSMPRVW